jgi:hypothetical protein
MRAILMLVALVVVGCGGKAPPSLSVSVKTGTNPYYDPSAQAKQAKERPVEDTKEAVEAAKTKEPAKEEPKGEPKTLKEKFESLKPEHLFEKYDDGVHEGKYKEKIVELRLEVLRVFPAKESHVQLVVPGRKLKSLILVCYFGPAFRDEIKASVKPGQMVRVRGKNYGWHHGGAYRDKNAMTDCGLIQAAP